tara:strand:+ start:2076 stop:2405 length:330 start_codon:yes stop_codon:yes gene_type:complete
MWWTIAFYTVQYCSTTSLWFMYHTVNGTYYTVKYIYKLTNDTFTPPEFHFTNSLEICEIQDEPEYNLILTKESLMCDLMHIYSNTYTDILKKNDLEQHSIYEIKDETKQ